MDQMKRKPSKFDKMVILLEKQLEKQEKIIELLDTHHKVAVKAWGLQSGE
jgi:hypothetical protein